MVEMEKGLDTKDLWERWAQYCQLVDYSEAHGMSLRRFDRTVCESLQADGL